jgi:hypothetical protein
MKFVETLNYQKLLDLIFGAKERIYVAFPGIDTELADALISRHENIPVKVLIDNSESSIRNGYGEQKAIEKLLEAGVELAECTGNFISFIIVDELGYYVFPQSRIFIGESIGTNAIRIDPTMIQVLLNVFFSSHSNSDLDEESISDTIPIREFIDEIIIEVQNGSIAQAKAQVKDFDTNKFFDIKMNLSVNPPLKPDLQRQINTYTAKIQFAELKFQGGRFNHQVVNIPKDALPIVNQELKSLLLSRIKLFKDIEKNEDFQIYTDYQVKVDQFRKKYLIPITCRESKSIIRIEDKETFVKEIETLKLGAKNLNIKLIDLMETEKYKAQDIFRHELRNYFESNPPTSLSKTFDPMVRNRKLNEEIEWILSKIKFPDMQKLMASITLTVQFYDLTWNDFKDETLLKEFKDKKIMKSDELHKIIEMKKAFDIEQ